MRFDFSLPFLVQCTHGRWRREDAGRIGAHHFIRQRKQHTVAACWLSRRLFKPRSPARWGLNSYNMFCDLVHPNIGSNFLVASINNGTVCFSQKKGDMVGHFIFEESFPLLVSVVIKPFVSNCLVPSGLSSAA